MTYFKIYHKGGKFDGNNIKVVDTEKEARAFIIDYYAKYAEQLKKDGATLYYTDKYNNVINWTPEEEKPEEESAEAVTPLEKHVDYYIDFINSAAFDPYEAINNDDLTEYDLEYTIDYRFNFLGARVMIAGGGPNIYIDTQEGAVIGYWGNETVKKYYSESAAARLSNYYLDLYNSFRS